MAKKHMKAITAPVTWPIKRKGNTFVIRPKPGKKFEMSVPLAIVFKNMLKSCKTFKEVKSILNDKEIKVDQKVTKNPKTLVGFMDVLSIPVSKEDYRMTLTPKKKLRLVKIDDKEATKKVCKITSKTVLKGGKTQLNFFDGRNAIVKKDVYKVGESVLVDLPSQDIKEQYKLEKGAYVFLIGGTHVGEHGTIQKLDKDMAEIKTKDGSFATLLRFLFIVGKEKPSVKLYD